MTTSEVVALIGDVVDSRSHPDRSALQLHLTAALEDSVTRTRPIQPPTMTIGDEFQGLYRTLDDALVAAFVIQIALVGHARIRFGLGIGAVVVMSEQGPFGQDGPAWWQAREGIEAVKAAERQYGAPPNWATGIGGTDERFDVHRAYLQLRDHVIAGIDVTDADIVRGLMAGETQSAIAGGLHIDKGAVSRRVSGHGISALLWSLPELNDA